MGPWRTRPGAALHRNGAPGGRAGRLRISRAVRRRFDGPAVIGGRPEHRASLREYVSDLVRPYGLPLREEPLARGDGHSYGEMAAALIDETVPADRPVDLAMLAYAVPDVRPGRATATYLSHVCPGHPFAFTVSDQGTAAAFTAARMAAGYGCQRVLLLVVEQATQLYDVDDATVPACHAAVALLFEESGPATLETVRQHADVAPERAGPLLAAELADLAAGRDDLTVIAGGGLATEPVDVAGRVRRAPAGQPSTGVWWELADELSGTGAVVLADYDPALRYLCLSLVALDPTHRSELW